jgi:uncharacterized protein (TIRG00374 family)
MRSRWTLWFGVAVSIVFLWVALRSISGRDLANAFGAIDYLAVLFCAAMVALGMGFRAIRWRIIAGNSKADAHCFSQATNLGVLSNLIFPGRAGEVLRVLRLSKMLPCPLPHALASAMIDRMADVSVLILSALIVYFYLPVAALLEKWLMVFGGSFVFLVVIAVLFFRRAHVWRDWFFAWLRRFLGKWGMKPEAFLSELFSELGRLAHGKLPVEILGISLAIWCADYAVIAAVLKSLHLSLPLEAPLLLWVFLSAGSALPSAPGYVGVYQVAAIWALSFYGVAPTTSVASALVLQVTTLAVALLMSGKGLREVFRQTTQG